MYKNGFLKIQVTSPRIIPGDPTHNVKFIKTVLDRSQASIVLFPELSLSGYSASDAFYHQDFLELCKKELKWLLENHTFKGLFVIGMPLAVLGDLYNVAVVIKDKAILGIVPKFHIPNGHEFYERRWFESGHRNIQSYVMIDDKQIPFGSMTFVDEAKSIHLGVEICEDLWHMDAPSDVLVKAGANIILNLSASSEFVGKEDIRRSLVKTQSMKQKSVYVYASTGRYESVSDVVFSNYKAVAFNGEITVESDVFNDKEQTIVSDIYVPSIEYERLRARQDNYGEKPNIRRIDMFFESTSDYQFERAFSKTPFVDAAPHFEVVANIQKIALAQKLQSLPSSITHIMLGLSGGVDSTLALLASIDALDHIGLDRSRIVCVSMPTVHTSKRAKLDAKTMAKKLGTKFLEVDITKEVAVHLKMINHEEKDITYENVQARIRTLVLMNLSNKHQGFVLGTGDLSEIALGFMTYNGDQASMYAINAGIPKTYAKALLNHHSNHRYKGLKKEIMGVLEAPVSPELNDNQITENEVGKYELNDFIIYHHFVNGFDRQTLELLLGQTFSLSDADSKQFVENFFKRFNASQFKRQTLAEGPKVFKVFFNPRGDYRLPSDLKRK